MKIQQIIKEIEQFEGNHTRNDGDIYITPSNMDKFAGHMENCEVVASILITPYLINLKDKSLYELLYYTFEMEVLEISNSNYIEYAKENVLPEEITRNIKPKAVVNGKDKDFYIKALNDYLKAMKNMAFEDNRKSDTSLLNAQLFYQIF
jgi:hypothetical protein